MIAENIGPVVPGQSIDGKDRVIVGATRRRVDVEGKLGGRLAGSDPGGGAK